jgi:molybdenum-dependent DNA-binding transcriptional regulator ModE
MRICGRTLRPSTLAERRVLLALGFPTIRVPRHANPFIVARRVGRLARGQTDDHAYLQELVRAHRQRQKVAASALGRSVEWIDATAQLRARRARSAARTG